MKPELTQYSVNAVNKQKVISLTWFFCSLLLESYFLFVSFAYCWFSSIGSGLNLFLAVRAWYGTGGGSWSASVCMYVYVCLLGAGGGGGLQFREVNGLLLKSRHIGDDSMPSAATVFQVCPIRRSSTAEVYKLLLITWGYGCTGCLFIVFFNTITITRFSHERTLSRWSNFFVQRRVERGLSYI